jgi:KDO2-lipid IV(A) lauroyltransferase
VINYYLYRLGQFIALNLPLKSAYKVAIFLSDLRYIFARKDREEVKGNLRAIFPEKTDKEIRMIRIRMFRNFAKYLVDFFRFQKIDKGYIKDKIRIENMHYFDQAIARNKGVVVLTAHLGNWELGGVVIAVSGYPFWVVALPHKQKKVNDFFNFQRESKGIKVIQLGKAVRTCLNILKENKMIGLVGDRDFTEKGVILDFFGKPTFFPEGPAAFSLQTGASIVPGFMIRNPDDSFTLKIEKPFESKSSGNKKNDIRNAILWYKDIFEKYIKEHPDQWYIFKKFWVSG